MNIQPSDFLTILLLVGLEGLLSADNAMVLAVLVLSLPRSQQRKGLRYGMVGAFAFRGAAILFAAYMIRLSAVKLLGGVYLVYLTLNHFFATGAEGRRHAAPAQGWMGLSPFWGTVVKVELTDLLFAMDSILVAVAMSPKLWVVLSGGILGIIMMRLVIGQLLTIVQRYPPLVDAAFIIIAWVGAKLLLEYLHALGYVDWVVPRWLSLGVIVVIFGAGYMYARWRGPAPAWEHVGKETVELLEGDER